MELREAAHRIFGVHRWLICAMVVLGLCGATAAHRALESSTYSASARLSLGGAPPQSTAEAAALAGTIQGIVTSPDRVAAALVAAHLDRDPVRFAAKQIDTQPFSASGILQLTVTDTDASGAAAVANSLALDAVTTLNQRAVAAMSVLQTKLQNQVDQLTAQMSQLDGQLASPSLLPAQQATLLAQRNDAAQQLAALAGKQADIQLQVAQQPQAAIVDGAMAPNRPDPSRLPLDLILGLLGGLVAGLGGAALLETLKPTAVGRPAVERALAAPVLGAVSRDLAVGAPELVLMSERVRRAAREAEVSTVLLWSGDQTFGLDQLAHGLQSARRAGTTAPPRRGNVRFAVLDPTLPPGPRQGVLAVVGRTTPLSTLEAVVELCRDNRWPLVGAILREGGPRRRRTRQLAPAAAAPRSKSALVMP
jgi:capsular polysaccharide biosynthesis protein